MFSFNICVYLIAVCIVVEVNSLPQPQQKSTSDESQQKSTSDESRQKSSTNNKSQPKRQPPSVDELLQITEQTVRVKIFMIIFKIIINVISSSYNQVKTFLWDLVG